MKTSSQWVLAAAIGVLMLQGCTATGDTRASAQAAAPAPVAVPATAVPEVNGKPVVNADTKDKFEAIVGAIRQQMQPGGRWQYIDKHELAAIDDSFADMQKLYGQFGRVSDMNQAAKVRLLADQSTVNAMLAKKDGERLICRTETPVGTHLPVTNCKTYAQIQAEKGEANDSLRKLDATRQAMHCGNQANGSTIAC